MNKKVKKKTELIYGPLANWKNADEYPNPKEAKKKGPAWWAWQFLRRNPEYQKAFNKIEKLSPPSDWIDFLSLPKPNPGESKTAFIKRADLVDKDINGKKLINQDSLYEWGAFCARFGINRPVNPKIDNPFLNQKIRKGGKVNNPSASSPPLDFTPHLDLRNPMKLLQGSKGLIILDLDEPVERNIKTVKNLLKKAEKILTSSREEQRKLVTGRYKAAGEKPPRQPSSRRMPWRKFPEYLRLLDGKAAGASNVELQRIFPDKPRKRSNPPSDFGAPEKLVSNGLKEARNWRNKDYMMFAKEMACILSHPEIPQSLYSIRSAYRSQ